VRRRRGKSPQQAAFFLRSGAGAEDAQALAAMLLLFGVVTTPAAAASGSPLGTRRQATARQPSLARGRLLCEAFETYRRIVPQPRIDFEHAVYLADALQRGDELRLRWCAGCEAVSVTERAMLRPTSCRCCGGALAETPTQRSGPRDTGRIHTH
jgi:hypothetical protein